MNKVFIAKQLLMIAKSLSAYEPSSAAMLLKKYPARNHVWSQTEATEFTTEMTTLKGRMADPWGHAFNFGKMKVFKKNGETSYWKGSVVVEGVVFDLVVLNDMVQK